MSFNVFLKIFQEKNFRSLPALENNRLRPVIQYLDSNDVMHAHVSKFVPDCLYSAHAMSATESSIVNLCGRNGGMVNLFIYKKIII